MKKYIGVKAECINTIDYIFTDKELLGRKEEYPMPKSMPVGGDSSVGIFEKYGIPEELQMLFISYNPVAIRINHAKETRLFDGRHALFKGKELLTNAYVNVSVATNEYYGNMYSNKPAFEFFNGFDCKREDVIKFLCNLREQNLMNNYLNAISELFKMNIKSDIDTNKMTK